MKDITDADYVHEKIVFKDFEINLSDYHHFYLKSNKLILPDVFEKFRKNVFRNISIRSCKTSFSSRIRFASSFKKD